MLSRTNNNTSKRIKDLPFLPANGRRIAGPRQVFSNAAMMRSRVSGMSRMRTPSA